MTSTLRSQSSAKRGIVMKPIEKRIVEALEYFRFKVDKPRCELAQLSLLLNLLETGDCNMQDLAASAKAAQSMVSRNAQNFGAKSTGTRLISLRIDDDDPRYRVVSLTPEGRKLLLQVVGIIEGTEDAPRHSGALDKRTK